MHYKIDLQRENEKDKQWIDELTHLPAPHQASLLDEQLFAAWQEFIAGEAQGQDYEPF